jgi:hypothetical protein
MAACPSARIVAGLSRIARLLLIALRAEASSPG